MSRSAAILAVEPGVFHKLLDPAKVFPEDDPAQIVVFVLFMRQVAMLFMMAHADLIFRKTFYYA